MLCQCWDAAWRNVSQTHWPLTYRIWHLLAVPVCVCVCVCVCVRVKFLSPLCLNYDVSFGWRLCLLSPSSSLPFFFSLNLSKDLIGGDYFWLLLLCQLSDISRWRTSGTAEGLRARRWLYGGAAETIEMGGGEDRPGGWAFSVITPTFQWDWEKDKRRELWAPLTLHDEVWNK